MISKYLETFFLFLYFKQKRNETKFFFRWAIKNEMFDHKKNRNVDIPNIWSKQVKTGEMMESIGRQEDKGSG